MRLYLEAVETVPLNQKGEFIRIDITGMSLPEQDAVQGDIEAIMSGKAYRLTRHYCSHDEGGACRNEVIKIA